MATYKTTAITILQQLGGNKFLAMTGSHQLTAIEKGCIMKLRRNQSGANYIRIKLNGLDLYDIEFVKMFKGEPTVKHEFNNIYCDQLVSIFEETTGLYTKLF